MPGATSRYWAPSATGATAPDCRHHRRKNADFQLPASSGGEPTLLTPLFWPPPDRMSDGDLAGTGMDLVQRFSPTETETRRRSTQRTSVLSEAAPNPKGLPPPPFPSRAQPTRGAHRRPGRGAQGARRAIGLPTPWTMYDLLLRGPSGESPGVAAARSRWSRCRACAAVGLPTAGARTSNTSSTGSRLLRLLPGPPAYAAPVGHIERD